MRGSEILDLTDANELPQGLLITRRKGSRANITLWNDRLKAIWDNLKATRDQILTDRNQPKPTNPKDRYLLISDRTGDKINESTLQTAWQRIRATAVATATANNIPFEPFNLHDLKRKGITDTNGTLAEKMDASGHRSPGMMNIYNVEKKEVTPTKG
jgi:hypothetical protein